MSGPILTYFSFLCMFHENIFSDLIDFCKLYTDLLTLLQLSLEQL